MRTLFIFLLHFFIYTPAIHAQRQPAVLWGESGDGKTVKLVWFLKSWERNMQGFDIKRRIADKKSNWEKLNNALIIPEIFSGKNLSNVEPDLNEQNRLKAKLQLLVSQKKIKEIPAAVYAGRLSNDISTVQSVAVSVAFDYDLALLSGFGATDRNTMPGNTYEYGLFFVSNGAPSEQPAATFNWTYGTKPMLDGLIRNVSADVMPKPFKIQLKWNADTGKLKSLHSAGYNIYKKNVAEWLRLNKLPISSQSKDYYVFSDSAASNVTATYGIAVISIFGNESAKTEFIYDPAITPETYKTPELGEIKSSGENFKDGFALQWTFPQEYEKYLKGFIVEKANLPAGYKESSSLMPVTARTYNEKSFSPPAGYLNFRVVAVYNNEKHVSGNERLFYYLPVIYAPKPANFTGRWIKEKDKTFILLKWDGKAAGDSLTDGYQLYATNLFDNKMYWENSVPLIKGNEYRYEVFNSIAAKYRFCIAAVSKYKTVGAFSDTILVRALTSSLPAPVIYPYTVDSARVTLNWNYPEIDDLKGFRIYQDGNMVASEFQLKKEIRKFVSPELRQGATYHFAIKAVTESGTESEMSIQREVLIDKK